jgi:hypothetical protein
MFVMQQAADKWPLAIKAGSVTVKIYKTVNRGRPMFTASYHEAGGRKLRQFAELVERIGILTCSPPANLSRWASG